METTDKFKHAQKDTMTFLVPFTQTHSITKSIKKKHKPLSALDKNA
jgi:hypothetical protein